MSSGSHGESVQAWSDRARATLPPQESENTNPVYGGTFELWWELLHEVADTGYPLSLATTAAPDAQFTLSMTPRFGRGGDHLGM